MSGDPQVETYHQQQVDIQDVGHSLAELWKKADNKEGDEGALVRACGLTVVGLADSDEDIAVMSTEVGLATTIVPARTLLVHIGAEVDGGISAEIAAFCTVGGPGRKQVCHEQVMLRATRERIDDLPSLINPLSVPDLPSVLILGDAAMLTSDLVDQLLPATDVVILDTEGVEDVRATYKFLRRLRDARRISARDLAFERLATWRESIATHYDEVLERDERLMAVEATTGANDGEAVIVLGWIESCLPPTRRPFVSLERTDAEKTTLRLTVGKGGSTRTIALERHGRHVIRVDECDDDTCTLPRPAPEDRHMLSHILGDPQNCHSFDKTVDAILERAAL